MPRALHELIARANQLADAFEAYEPKEGDFGKDVPPLMAVRLAAYRRTVAERDLADAIAAARRDAISWRELGQALGTSGEAARQRYSNR